MAEDIDAYRAELRARFQGAFLDGYLGPEDAATAGNRLRALYEHERARLRAERQARQATPTMIRLRTDVLNGAVGGPDDGAAA